MAIDVYRHERRHRGVEAIDSSDPALVSMPPSVEQIYDVWQVRQAWTSCPTRIVSSSGFSTTVSSATEIASELEIPLGTVKSRSFRAHKRLAGLLGHLRADPEDSSPAAEPEGGSDG